MGEINQVQKTQKIRYKRWECLYIYLQMLIHDLLHVIKYKSYEVGIVAQLVKLAFGMPEF